MDGSVLFNSTVRLFPSTTTTKPKHCLFKLSSDYKRLELVTGSDQILPGYLYDFEPNEDGSAIVFSGGRGAIQVLDTSSGKITELEKDGPEGQPPRCAEQRMVSAKLRVSQRSKETEGAAGVN
jgi:hypothetical protein